MTDLAWWWAVPLVALGGALGAMARHALSQPPLGQARGVLVANVAGCAGLGALVAVADRLAPGLVLLLGTGLSAALTTWSTLAVLTWQLGRRDVGRAAAYLGLTLVLGLSAAGLAWSALS
ncbi:fluoride efflux transporter FluC [Ornithinimicrobium flavum]|uniref:fluoride efflux transporter FluC n=1 Tax=Ornithinimicrobium flavum TaxID=1288636 RepID=UPI0010704069|nr:CrcB family protein [Ornithinimicrobium flavum]